MTTAARTAEHQRQIDQLTIRRMVLLEQHEPAPGRGGVPVQQEMML